MAFLCTLISLLLGYLAAALLFWGLTAKLGQTLPVMASAMVLVSRVKKHLAL